MLFFFEDGVLCESCCVFEAGVLCESCCIFEAGVFAYGGRARHAEGSRWEIEVYNLRFTRSSLDGLWWLGDIPDRNNVPFEQETPVQP